MKSSYPDKFLSNSKIVGCSLFRGDGCLVTPRDDIVYKNLGIWEITC